MSESQKVKLKILRELLKIQQLTVEWIEGIIEEEELTPQPASTDSE